MSNYRPPSVASSTIQPKIEGPAEIVASAPPLSKAAIAGYTFGALLILLGLLDITAGKDPDLGPMADAAQGIKQTKGMVYLGAGVNTCMIATLCQHTKKKT